MDQLLKTAKLILKLIGWVVAIQLTFIFAAMIALTFIFIFLGWVVSLGMWII